MSREHVTPKATGWAYGLTEPAVIEVEDALTTLQQMWDYCDDIKRNHRSFGGNDMLMRQWSKALTVVEKMAAKYLDQSEPTAWLPELGSKSGRWTPCSCGARPTLDEAKEALSNCSAYQKRIRPLYARPEAATASQPPVQGSGNG